MKTTLEISDELFRRVKATAALEGCSMKDFVSKALEEKLDPLQPAGERPWMKGFGALAHLSAESRSVEKWIEEEFESIEPEDRP